MENDLTPEEVLQHVQEFSAQKVAECITELTLTVTNLRATLINTCRTFGVELPEDIVDAYKKDLVNSIVLYFERGLFTKDVEMAVGFQEFETGFDEEISKLLKNE